MKQLLVIISLVICFSYSAHATSLQGTVSDSTTGRSVSGASLVAFTFAENGDSLVFEARSDESGNFFFGDLPNGTYILQCSHADYITQTKRNIQITSTDISLYYHFRLQVRDIYPDTYISGHVYSVSEVLPAFIPLENATVVLSGEIVRFSATSDENGIYFFKGIPAGWYFLSAFAKGHIPQHNIDTIFVQENSHIDNLDIFLTPYDSEPANLSGTVFANNLNYPVYPASLSLFPVFSGNTDSIYFKIGNEPDGSYLFTAVPPGIYRLECRASDYQTYVEPALDLTGSDLVYDIYMIPTDQSIDNYIAGTVINVYTSLPVYNAQVDLISIVPPELDMPSFLYTTYANDQGQFDFSSVTPGKYQLTAWSPGFNISDPETLIVEVNTRIKEIKLEIKPLNVSDPVTLKGFVFSDSFYPVPVYPAEIVLLNYSAENESVMYTTVTNPDGSYSFEDIKPSNYTIWCHAAGYRSQVINNLNLFTDTRLNFYLEPEVQIDHGYISGYVHYDGSNKPVPGAVLAFFAINSYSPDNHYVITDSSGFYRADLPAGQYYVSCSNAEVTVAVIDYYFYQEFYDDVHSILDATPVMVYPGEESTAINFGIPEFPFTIEIRVSGMVTDDRNNPLSEAVVQLWTFHPQLINSSEYFENQTRTRDDGTYELIIQLPAWYARYGFIVSAQKKGYLTEFYEEKSVPYLADVLWAWGDTSFTDIDFTLEPVGDTFSISGRVTNEAGKGVSDAFVTGFRVSTGEVVFTSTDSSGQYTLSQLNEDSYYILFLAQGYIPEFFDDALSWEDAIPVYVFGNIYGIHAELQALSTGTVNGIIAGHIFDALQEPVPGAVVTARDASGNVVAAAFSDQTGYYELANFSGGVHVIHVTKVKYKSTSTSLRIENLDANMMIVDITMDQTLTATEEQSALPPKDMSLLQNYPNPFNPLTTIRFSLPHSEKVRLSIYNLLGQRIRMLLEGSLEAGSYSVSWDGTDYTGRTVSSGIYFMALEAAGKRMVKKLILSK